MPPDAVEIARQDQLAFVTIAHRGEGNLLDSTALRELADAFEAVSGAPGVRVAILSAEGDAFSRGWDWEGLAAPSGDRSLVDTARGFAAPADPLAFLRELRLPVVCALNGDAASVGLEIALACDIRIAAEGARFSLPEVGLGLLPLAGGIQRLARLVGRGRALQMVLTGDPLDADEALACGLVNRVVPREKVTEEARALAARVAERGPLAVGYAREAVGRGLDMPLEQALRFETDLTVILQTTEDRAEGVRAFIEKRKPDFKGR